MKSILFSLLAAACLNNRYMARRVRARGLQADVGRVPSRGNIAQLCNQALAAAASAVLVSGCATGGAYAPQNTTKYDLENRAPFVLLDAGAEHSVTCSGIQQRPLDDGRLEVTANVRNRENRRIEVQVNCEFKDEQDFVVDATPFQVLILTENAQESVKFTSLNNQARKYT